MFTREDFLKETIKRAEQELQKLPKGRVSHQRAEYWRYTGPKKIKTLRGPNNDLLKALILRSYLEQVSLAASKELDALQVFHNALPVLKVEDVYGSLSVYRQALIQPINKLYIEEWLQQPYPSYNSIPLDDKFPTGVPYCPFVRSKSEVWEVQGMDAAGIAFLYEFPLKLVDMHGNIRVIYPDFTILNLNTHDVIYWEHFGKMDNPDYLNSFKAKQQLYACNDIYGSRLYQTFETAAQPLTMVEVQAVIEDIKRVAGY